MTKPQSMTTIELPSSSMASSAATIARTAENHLQVQRAPTKLEIKVAEKTRFDLAKQLGMAIKEEHAAHLISVIDQRAITRWDEFLIYDRSLRNKPRDSRDQADFEAVAQAIRQGHANSTLTLRNQVATAIELISAESVDPDVEKKPRARVVEKPPLWGLFGGREVTEFEYD